VERTEKNSDWGSGLLSTTWWAFRSSSQKTHQEGALTSVVLPIASGLPHL